MDWFKNLRASAEALSNWIGSPPSNLDAVELSNSDSEDELDEVWLDDNVVEYVKNLCETGVFRDFPKEALEELKGFTSLFFFVLRKKNFEIRKFGRK